MFRALNRHSQGGVITKEYIILVHPSHMYNVKIYNIYAIVIYFNIVHVRLVC